MRKSHFYVAKINLFTLSMDNPNKVTATFVKASQHTCDDDNILLSGKTDITKTYSGNLKSKIKVSKKTDSEIIDIDNQINNIKSKDIGQTRSTTEATKNDKQSDVSELTNVKNYSDIVKSNLVDVNAERGNKRD